MLPVGVRLRVGVAEAVTEALGDTAKERVKLPLPLPVAEGVADWGDAEGVPERLAEAVALGWGVAVAVPVWDRDDEAETVAKLLREGEAEAEGLWVAEAGDAVTEWRALALEVAVWDGLVVAVAIGLRDWEGEMLAEADGDSEPEEEAEWLVAVRDELRVSLAETEAVRPEGVRVAVHEEADAGGDSDRGLAVPETVG